MDSCSVPLLATVPRYSEAVSLLAPMVYGVISGFMLVAIGEHDGWGRIHQIEYADKAVTEGSATVGIKSSTHAVLVALKRSSHELSGHQKKIYSVDEHIGVSIAGLLSDARLLARFMQSECLSWRWLHQGAMPISLLVSNLQTKMQVNTQRYGRRPFGVGLLIAGYDIHGPHIIQTCPSATSFECYAMSIGARSQSAKTYLEKHMSEFNDSDVKTLVRHALLALRGTLPTEVTLSTKNSSVGIVGKGMPFTVYDQEDVSPYLECISDALSASQESTAATEEPASPMDTAVEVTDEARDS